MEPTEITPVEEGQHYEHTRGDIYTVDYMNGDIILLYDGSNYRLEQEDYFEKEVDSGRFKFRPDLVISDSEERIPFEEIDMVGEKAIESLERANILTPKQFDYLTDERISELDSVGKTTVQNIREWIADEDDEDGVATVEI